MDSWDLTFIKVATLMAKHSTCVRKQVGAVIVKNNRIISTGYNGVPSGMKHCNEVFTKSAMAKLTDAEFYTEMSQKIATSLVWQMNGSKI